jgi:hypothetical protein
MLDTKAAHGKLNVETYLSLLSAIIASWAIPLAQAVVCIFIGTCRGATLELKRCLMEYIFVLACAMIPTGASWAPSRTCDAERTQIVIVDGHWVYSHPYV